MSACLAYLVNPLLPDSASEGTAHNRQHVAQPKTALFGEFQELEIGAEPFDEACM